MVNVDVQLNEFESCPDCSSHWMVLSVCIVQYSCGTIINLLQIHTSYKTEHYQINTNLLKWVAYESNFKPYDKGFKQWAIKGITAWCVLVKDGQLESLQNMKEIYDLDKREFYRYLQLLHYFMKEIRMDPSREGHGVI